MTVLELFEPIFIYICRLNRSARKGDWSEYNKVRAEVKAIFEGMKARAEKEPGLHEQHAKAEPPVIFFVDAMIAESNVSYAAKWHENRLAYERNELAGDERFWVMLDETLADKSKEATARLAVFYTCIGLGFVGDHVGEPELLRNKMAQCAARLGNIMDADEESRICPEAYEHVDTSNLTYTPTVRLAGIGTALVLLLIVVFFAQIVLFNRAASGLIDALDTTISHERVGDTPSGPAEQTPGGE